VRDREYSRQQAEWIEALNNQMADLEARMMGPERDARSRALRETTARFCAAMESIATDMAAADKFCESKGLAIPARPLLPYFTESEADFMLKIFVCTEEIKRIDLKGDKAQEWIATRERINTRLKAINDERALAHEAKAAEAWAEAERRQAERERAQKELEEMQRKLAEADAAAKQAADEADRLDKLRGKAPVEA
jgi:hypothetical protein